VLYVLYVYIQSGLENYYKQKAKGDVARNIQYIFLLSQDIVCIEIYKAINKKINCIRNKSRLSMKC